MKFKVIKTDLSHDGKLYPEGSIVNLPEEVGKALPQVLQPVEESPAKPEAAKTENKQPAGSSISADAAKVNEQRGKGKKGN